MNQPNEEQVKIRCNKCNRETRHRHLAPAICDGGDDSDQPWSHGYWWSVRTEILACCGCDEVTVRRVENSSEHDSEGEVTYFPPRAFHQKPDWAKHLPWQVQQLLESVYTVMYAQGARLAGVGIRTLLDDLILDRVGDCGTFKDKLNRMVSGGHLTAADRGTLEAVLELGHAATHRSYNPPVEQLRVALVIVESLLHRFHVIPNTLDTVTKGVPPKA